MTHSDIPEKVKGLLTTLTLPIYIGAFPKTADECISIWLDDTAGSSNFFGQSESLLRPVIRFMVRSVSYPIANDNCKIIKDVLDKYHDEDLLGFVLIGTIQYLGRDAIGRHEFRQSYKSIIKE